MKKAELLFIPAPAVGHLTAAMEMANLLVSRDERLSITVAIIKLPFESKATTQNYPKKKATQDETRMRCIDLPCDNSSPQLKPKYDSSFFVAFVESKKADVRNVAAGITNLAGLVVDLFCTTMMDVADEFNVPSYSFYTSGAASLGLLIHLESLPPNPGPYDFIKSPDDQLSIPSFSNLVPATIFLAALFDDKVQTASLLDKIRKCKNTKGIIINTFLDLESYALRYLSNASNNIPRVYSMGPLLNLEGSDSDEIISKYSTIMSWLDEQPRQSVLFLCFGSMGWLREDQVKEIAIALEGSGHRFLWSLLKPPPEGVGIPGEYVNFDEVLPEGFLERTAGMGRVIGWAPQGRVLSHPAVGGFVSHCGWNSILESLWCGVPMAAWPLYAEQHQNALEIAREMELAVEIKMDYRMKLDEPLVAAEEIERKIRVLMMEDGEVRKKVKEMKEKSREAMIEGGSSYTSLGHFIDDVFKNMHFH